MRHSSHGLRIALLAGASVVALAAAVPNADAADLSRPILKAPPVSAARDTWTWWIEGGAFRSDGDGVGAPAFKPNWGGEGAAGFDWQPTTSMHVIGQFRYGTASRTSPLQFTAISGPTTVHFSGPQDLREDHWLVDFGIGRDFGLGTVQGVWTLGVRVADLRSELNVNATVLSTAGGAPVGGANALSQQRSTFVGAGPRLGVQGGIPLGGQWSIDWLAGAAVLFGERNVTLTSAGVTTPITGTTSDTTAIFNVDAQAGLSYWFSPTMKITASYRYDEYFRALKTLTTNPVFGPTGPVITASNIDRSFSGPMLRLTSKF